MKRAGRNLATLYLSAAPARKDFAVQMTHKHLQQYCEQGYCLVQSLIDPELVEAVRQLRGDAGDRQIDGAELAMAHGNGGVLSSQVTNILGTESTL